MAIWDTLSSNPLQAMILGQALQGFAGGLSKRNGPPSNAYVPQGYGGGGGQGGGGFDIGDMLRMQQLQAQQANMTADNELARQQFEYKKTAAQQQQSIDEEGYKQLSEKTGWPVAALRTLGVEGLKAVAAGLDPNVASQIQDRTHDNSVEDSRLALERSRFGLEKANSQRKVADDMLTNKGLISLGSTLGFTPEQSLAMRDQLTQLVKSRNEPSTLGVTQTRFAPGPDGTPVPVASGATPEAIDAASAIANAGNPGVATGARAYADKRATDAADQWKSIQQNAASSLGKFQKLEILNNMIGDLPTGRIAEGPRQAIQKGLRDLGVDVDVNAISTREAAVNFADTMGVQMLNDQAEGLKGISSDRDVALFLGLQPGINMTKQGRELNIDIKRAETKYVNDLADHLNSIEQNKGDFLTPVEQQKYISEYAKTHSIYEGVSNKWKGKIGNGNAGVATPPSAPGSGVKSGVLSPAVEERLSKYPPRKIDPPVM